MGPPTQITLLSLEVRQSISCSVPYNEVSCRVEVKATHRKTVPYHKPGTSWNQLFYKFFTVIYMYQLPKTPQHFEGILQFNPPTTIFSTNIEKMAPFFLSPNSYKRLVLECTLKELLGTIINSS